MPRKALLSSKLPALNGHNGRIWWLILSGKRMIFNSGQGFVKSGQAGGRLHPGTDGYMISFIRSLQRPPPPPAIIISARKNAERKLKNTMKGGCRGRERRAMRENWSENWLLCYSFEKSYHKRIIFVNYYTYEKLTNEVKVIIKNKIFNIQVFRNSSKQRKINSTLFKKINILHFVTIKNVELKKQHFKTSNSFNKLQISNLSLKTN